jgi:VIT1/CCC1 family predicted Fe2+/Mn2+ transporter
MERVGRLRAAVLGANDGILSTASLVLGVATAHATHHNVLVAGAVSPRCPSTLLPVWPARNPAA